MQIEVLRRLGPSGRVRVAAEMSEDAREIAFDSELRRHPELGVDAARRAVFARMWGAELADAVFGRERPER